MTAETSFSIAVVCEAAADQRTACELADRVLCDAIDWLNEDLLLTTRSWRGLNQSTKFMRWADTKSSNWPGVKIPHGHFDGKPAFPDAAAARRALRLLEWEGDPSPNAVILIRDTDGDLERLTGLEQARDESTWKVPIVIGVAHTKRECWILNGFEPRDTQEHKRLEECKSALGFDPRTDSQKLTASPIDAKKNPKQALQSLVEGDPDRERQCWMNTSLGVLRSRGVGSKLADYLKDLHSRLVPLFSGKTAHPK